MTGRGGLTRAAYGFVVLYVSIGQAVNPLASGVLTDAAGLLMAALLARVALQPATVAETP